jgi:hypothetical protein
MARRILFSLLEWIDVHLVRHRVYWLCYQTALLGIEEETQRMESEDC